MLSRLAGFAQQSHSACRAGNQGGSRILLLSDEQTVVYTTPLRRRFAVTYGGDSIVASEWLSAGERRKQAPTHSLPGIASDVAAQLHEYFRGKLAYFALPLVFKGTELEQAIWKAVARIPFGMTVSYGEVARAVGAPGAHRAVARSMAKLAFALFVPAHRVVGADGRVKGAGSDSMRVRLLEFERAYVGK